MCKYQFASRSEKRSFGSQDFFARQRGGYSIVEKSGRIHDVESRTVIEGVEMGSCSEARKTMIIVLAV